MINHFLCACDKVWEEVILISFGLLFVLGIFFEVFYHFKRTKIKRLKVFIYSILLTVLFLALYLIFYSI